MVVLIDRYFSPSRCLRKADLIGKTLIYICHSPFGILGVIWPSVGRNSLNSVSTENYVACLRQLLSN